MVLRVITIAALVVAGPIVAAQTPGSAQIAPDARHQVQVFEASLRAAIEKAGGDMLKRASEVVKDISLRFETAIRVNSAIMPNGEGVTFFIEVPAIEATSLTLFLLSQKFSPSSARPVANGVDVAPAPPPIVPPMNPGLEYSEFTRQALVDTILDNAFAVPLKEGQRLTLVVDGSAGPPTAQISGPPRKLYLSIKSEDLVALRENRIDREEARKRIKEDRY